MIHINQQIFIFWDGGSTSQTQCSAGTRGGAAKADLTSLPIPPLISLPISNSSLRTVAATVLSASTPAHFTGW